MVEISDSFKAYCEGWCAAKENLSVETCIYDNQNKSYKHWMQGYYDFLEDKDILLEQFVNELKEVNAKYLGIYLNKNAVEGSKTLIDCKDLIYYLTLRLGDNY